MATNELPFTASIENNTATKNTKMHKKDFLWSFELFVATGQLLHTMTGNFAFVGHDDLVSANDLGNLHVSLVPIGELLCNLQSAPHNPAHHLDVFPDSQHLALRLDNSQVQLLNIAPE